MNISARNVFKGTLAAIRAGAVECEAVVELPSGLALVAIVTATGARNAGLIEGATVWAFVKAQWVMVMTQGDDAQLSARNCFRGVVVAVESGTVNSEVTIELADGTKIVSVITQESVINLGLRPGIAATAVIKASSVILGRPAA